MILDIEIDFESQILAFFGNTLQSVKVKSKEHFLELIF